MSIQPSWLLNWPLEPVPPSEKPVYGHPELERPDYVTLKSGLLRHPAEVQTCVDILDVPLREDARSTQSTNLTHDQLCTYIEATSSTPMALRVLFLNDTQLEPASPRLEASFDDTQVALHPSTIFYLIKHLGVCPIFLSNITITPWLLDTGNALFKTFKQDTSNQGSKSLSSVQGFFCYSVRGRPAHAWYKHDLELGSSTYIIQYCPEGTKTNLMRWATAPNKATRRLALRPMLLETMIIDEVAWNWSKGVVENARKLLAYEHLAPEQYGDGLLSSAVHDLHNLSQHFYIMQEELNGIAEQLEYLGKVHSLISSTIHTKWVDIRGGESSTSVVDSLLFLQSRTRNWHRWVQNWRERTNVRINLFFNLATTKIATETRRDSSSMITIAALTLLFLPGTFISGLFSMPFFQTAPQRLEAGSKRMAMAYGWWIYPAVTIPFTVLVFLVWIMWMRRRDKELPEANRQPEGPWNRNPLDSKPSRLTQMIYRPSDRSLDRSRRGDTRSRRSFYSGSSGRARSSSYSEPPYRPYAPHVTFAPSLSSSSASSDSASDIPIVLSPRSTPMPPPILTDPSFMTSSGYYQTQDGTRSTRLRPIGVNPDYARPNYAEEGFQGLGMWAPEQLSPAISTYSPGHISYSMPSSPLGMSSYPGTYYNPGSYYPNYYTPEPPKPPEAPPSTWAGRTAMDYPSVAGDLPPVPPDSERHRTTEAQTVIIDSEYRSVPAAQPTQASEGYRYYGSESSGTSTSSARRARRERLYGENGSGTSKDEDDYVPSPDLRPNRLEIITPVESLEIIDEVEENLLVEEDPKGIPE